MASRASRPRRRASSRRDVRVCVIALAALAIGASAPSPLAAQRTCDALVPAAPSGGWSAPLDTRVSLHVTDVSLRDALDRLTAISGVPLAYSAESLPVDRRVCLSAEREPLGALLAALLRGASVKVLIVSGRVVLAPERQPSDEPASRSVSVLERVVVTGSAVAAPRRPLAVGMEVIDGEQLRRQALSSLADILDANVPGLWSWSQSPATLVAQYGGVRGASSFGSSSPKIYIDGVEVANPLVVTQINPDVIDRIEVIRGPQGAALYGSDAISGVINVLTRHDGGATSAPSVLFHSTAGAAGSAYVAGLVPTHEQRLTVRTGTNIRSAGFAATFGQTGALIPSSASRQITAIGDARLVTARETLNIAARFYDKRSGVGRNPLLASFIPATPAPPTGSAGPSPSAPTVVSSGEPSQSVRQYTLSTSAAFATQGAWTHSVLAGVDGYSLSNVADAIGPIPTALDSALRAARGNGDRYTVRGSSVAHIGSGGDALGTFTLGVEHSVLRQATTSVTTRRIMAGQSYPTAVEGSDETWNRNTGLLSQLSMTWQESIFLTGGLRVERNDNFTGSNRFPVLPMVGLAVVRSLGAAEVKWRAAYGKGIRPPQTPARSAASGYAGGLGWSSGTTGVLPALDPEVQAGYEAGAELYLGSALQFQLTRFDQRVTGLIQSVAVAVETFANGAAATERRVRYQLQNVGEITNTGWEARGSFAKGPFMLASALSSVDSRVRALATGYKGDLRPNDRMLAVPARTGSLTLSWTGNRWTAALGATRAMDWINYDRLTLARDYAAAAGTTPGVQSTNDFTGALLRTYWRTYDGETHLRLTATRDMSRGIALLVGGENLLGGQLGEPDNVTIRPGRTVTAGLRASF